MVEYGATVGITLVAVAGGAGQNSDGRENTEEALNQPIGGPQQFAEAHGAVDIVRSGDNPPGSDKPER